MTLVHQIGDDIGQPVPPLLVGETVGDVGINVVGMQYDVVGDTVGEEVVGDAVGVDVVGDTVGDAVGDTVTKLSAKP